MIPLNSILHFLEELGQHLVTIYLQSRQPACCSTVQAEMAPPRWRGRLNTLVQLGTIGGIVVGTGINVGASFLEWGWRLPLALAAVPGSILLLGEPPGTLRH